MCVCTSFIYSIIYSILQILRYLKRLAIAGFRTVVNNTETNLTIRQCPTNPSTRLWIFLPTMHARIRTREVVWIAKP